MMGAAAARADGADTSGRWRLPRRRPIATVSLLAVTVVLTVLQFPFPQVRTALWRDPDAIAAGQWWRLATAMFVQYDKVWQIVAVLACIAAVGVLAERVYGHGPWLLLYLGCGVLGQAFGYLWEPLPDAGASVAGAGLLGAVCAWLLSAAGPRLARVRVWGRSGRRWGSCSPRRATCTARRCWRASVPGRCWCGATGAAWRSVPGSRQGGTPGGRGHRWLLAPTTGPPGGANLGGVTDLTAYWKEASDEQPRRWGSRARTSPGGGALPPVGPAVGPPGAQPPPGPGRR